MSRTIGHADPPPSVRQSSDQKRWRTLALTLTVAASISGCGNATGPAPIFPDGTYEIIIGRPDPPIATPGYFYSPPTFTFVKSGDEMEITGATEGLALGPPRYLKVLDAGDLWEVHIDTSPGGDNYWRLKISGGWCSAEIITPFGEAAGAPHAVPCGHEMIEG